MIFVCRIPNVVTDYIKLLDLVHRQHDALTMTCRKVYEYLGMTLDFERKD